MLDAHVLRSQVWTACLREEQLQEDLLGRRRTCGRHPRNAASPADTSVEVAGEVARLMKRVGRSDLDEETCCRCNASTASASRPARRLAVGVPAACIAGGVAGERRTG